MGDSSPQHPRQGLHYIPPARNHPGFPDWCARGGAHLKPTQRNLKSAYDRPEIISAYIQREVNLKRMAPLLSLPTTASLQVSPFGAIPKKNKPDKWHLIVDLSSPEGYSVNDAIRWDLCSVLYTSVDKAVVLAQSLGQGCLLAKLDLKEAYRAVPVHPSDQCLLAVSWNGTTYLDRALPFGLRSAPKLFSALTDAMMCFLHDRGVRSAVHYLDDFLVMGPPGQNGCSEALTTTLVLCEELGFPVAPEKTEGPATTLTFLGIEIDAEKLQLRLPQVKLSQLAAIIAGWMRVAGPPECTALRKAGVTVTTWAAEPCSHGSETWVSFHAKPHRCLYHSTGP